eukprot:768011-Hanusia_phi.AAC.2
MAVGWRRAAAATMAGGSSILLLLLLMRDDTSQSSLIQDRFVGFLGGQRMQPVMALKQEIEARGAGGKGVNWGGWDCLNWGPDWESRAIGCDRPGGCGAVGVGLQETSCGKFEDVCFDHFKFCLSTVPPGMDMLRGRKPTPDDCDCYQHMKNVGCPETCAASIFTAYGKLSDRCYGFDVLEGCKYIDSFRAPQDRYFTLEGMTPAHVGREELLRFKERAMNVKAEAARKEARRSFVQLEDEPLEAPPADADLPGMPEANEEESAAVGENLPGEEEEAVEVELPPPSNADVAWTDYAAALEAADPELQYRKPAGTYIQEDKSGTLIEPWQMWKHSYEPREDPEWYDDDDPRE